MVLRLALKAKAVPRAIGMPEGSTTAPSLPGVSRSLMKIDLPVHFIPGFRVQRAVFDMQGGMTKDAGVVLHTIAPAVAAAESMDPERCKEEMLQQIAIAISRASADAIKRRRRQPCSSGAAETAQHDPQVPPSC